MIAIRCEGDFEPAIYDEEFDNTLLTLNVAITRDTPLFILSRDDGSRECIRVSKINTVRDLGSREESDD